MCFSVFRRFLQNSLKIFRCVSGFDTSLLYSTINIVIIRGIEMYEAEETQEAKPGVGSAVSRGWSIMTRIPKSYIPAFIFSYTPAEEEAPQPEFAGAVLGA